MAKETIPDFIVKNNFFVRPSSRNGLWVFFLLPISIIISLMKHPVILTPHYKFATLVSFTLICNSLYIISRYIKNQKLKIIHICPLTISVLTGTLFNICLHKGWIFSLANGFLITLGFLHMYRFLLNKLKYSFTLGEAGLVAQTIILFVNSLFYNIFHMLSIQERKYRSKMQTCTLIIQVGLLGLMLLSYIVYMFNIKGPKTFYLTAFITITLSVIVPLHLIMDQSPLIWIFEQVLSDILLLKLFIYWSFCIAVAVLAVRNQIFYAKKASTSVRKIFHIISVLVYIPGLYYRCSFFYLSTGVVLGIFFALEILRIQSIPPLGSQLQEGYIVFNDEKDSGLLALTPIYLLTGISLPIWIHPAPCDVTDSAQFTLLPVLSGLLSIGIGDTSASYIGSNFGRLKWKGTSKTIEGTLAYIFSQMGFIYLLHFIGCLAMLDNEQIVRISLAVLVTAIVEAKTSQIDNLVLPFIMYIFLV